jgi:nicotinate-nucleotide adenylyltransferase
VSGPSIRPLGLFGGSFDPVHNAHLQLGRTALETLGLAAVRWLPNSVPGHREGPRAAAEDRLEMLKIALADETRFAIDQTELWQTEPTYSVDTLLRLRGELGTQVPLVFIVGADHLLGLHRWRDWRKLLTLTHFAVAQRPGHEISESAMAPEVAAEYARRHAPLEAIGTRAAGSIVAFACAPMDISSTSIRAAIAAGNDVGKLLPAAVLAYIDANRLYGAPT